MTMINNLWSKLVSPVLPLKLETIFSSDFYSEIAFLNSKFPEIPIVAEVEGIVKDFFINIVPEKITFEEINTHIRDEKRYTVQLL